MSAKKTPDESEIRKFAMRLYLRTGGKKVRSILTRIEKDFGQKVSRSQFNVWCDTEGWNRMLSQSKERRKEMELQEKSFKQIMFDALKERKEAYELYFKTLAADKMDNNAHWAYKDILTKLDSLQEEIERETEQEETVSEQQKIVNAMGVYGADY